MHLKCDLNFTEISKWISIGFTGLSGGPSRALVQTRCITAFTSV